MMTVLVPMSAGFYVEFAEQLAKDYAEENVTAGLWRADTALERARSSTQSALPQGIDTPDNYLYEIRAEEHSETAGYLWFANVERYGVRSAFVYELTVFPQFRRQGHAAAAFRLMEDRLRDLGSVAIELNVFASNPGAQALYASLGYVTTKMNMRKPL
ncbi:GNAT family N-acetyltransferase [Rahnella sp. BIGb0236]|uniref:GNAT family N-acetyltransferase n=1 Tax=Rahnella sp. BIGb0236 TaxID=2485117 RepID=UPI001FB934F4|nr:GNAT family N-acetyltransferase [Rahnella sp. BIGb0236]